MRSRRKCIELAAALLLLASSALVLSLSGRSHRIFVSPPRTEQVTRPQDAYGVWSRYRVHGRALVLMDRHLNAEPVEHGSFEFTPDEFSSTAAMQALCRAIRDSDYGPVGSTAPCTTDGLNGILRTQDFYDLWKRRNAGMPVPQEILDRLFSIRAAAPFAQLPEEWKNNIIEANRRLLELSYPGIAPVKSPLSFVGSDNYVYEAIRAGYIRKIYHVVPDSAWPEVERTLRSYRIEQPSPETFRMTIENFTPVAILRLRDLPRISESVLLNIDRAYWTDAELAEATTRITSDLVTISDTAHPGARAPGSRHE